MTNNQLKQAILEELDYRLHSALNYPIQDEITGGYIPYDSTDEGDGDAQQIKDLVSNGIEQIILSTTHQCYQEIRGGLDKIEVLDQDEYGFNKIIYKDEVINLLDDLIKKVGKHDYS